MLTLSGSLEKQYARSHSCVERFGCTHHRDVNELATGAGAGTAGIDARPGRFASDDQPHVATPIDFIIGSTASGFCDSDRG